MRWRSCTCSTSAALFCSRRPTARPDHDRQRQTREGRQGSGPRRSCRTRPSASGARCSPSPRPCRPPAAQSQTAPSERWCRGSCPQRMLARTLQTQASFAAIAIVRLTRTRRRASWPSAGVAGRRSRSLSARQRTRALSRHPRRGCSRLGLQAQQSRKQACGGQVRHNKHQSREPQQTEGRSLTPEPARERHVHKGRDHPSPQPAVPHLRVLRALLRGGGGVGERCVRAAAHVHALQLRILSTTARGSIRKNDQVR